jgi:hypothetical protein
MGPRAGLNAVVKRKIPSPFRDPNPRPSIPYPSAISLSHPGSGEGGGAKGNVFPELQHHVMKTFGGVEVKLQTFINVALHKGKWST